MTAVVNSRTPLYQGRVFSLLRENVTLQNGVTTDLDTIRHPGASAVVPLLDSETLLLLRQYRHAVGGFLWEIPAGTLMPEEVPLACAKRELTEETGFSALEWHPLGPIVPVPGYSDERIHIFLATRLAPATQNLDRDEVLEVHRIPWKEATDMIRQGTIQDSKTICGLFRASLWLDK